MVKFPDQAERVLRSLCIEMDNRYMLFSKAVVNDVKLYNDKYRDRYLLPTEGHHYMPYIVVIIDEYADLIMTSGMGGNSKNMAKSITTSIIRLAQKELPLEEVIRKVTSLPAELFHLRGRGTIRCGSAADLVLFDREELCDCADFASPHAFCTGIHQVYVNGVLSYENREVTGRAGKILKK